MNRWEQTVKKVLTWTVCAGLALGLVFLLTYRYCEQFGLEAENGCLAAGIVAAAGGVGAFWPLGKAWWKQKSEEMIGGVVLGVTIRLLVGFVGVVIIFLVTNINRRWFLGCYGLFYLFFLLADSWLMICLLRYHSLYEEKTRYE